MATLLGIDTGGTYTDAVIFDEERGVVASAKALTTKHDLALGVRGAVEAVLPQAPAGVELVSLSTTLATNALVEGQGSPVCLLLIGSGPEVLARSDLGRALASDPVAFIAGGHGPSGDEQVPLDLAAARAAILEHAPKVAAFTVAGFFSVRNPAHEVALRDLIRELTGLPVTCAHELTTELDAPRRAMTAVLNARLIPLLQQLILAVRDLLTERDIEAPLMVVKGDGSLIAAEAALARPIETILSGPAASVVGAQALSGERDVLVSDMGGTTTDIALLTDGQPALNRTGATVGGWRTMVEAVSVHTVGIGGDSEVRLDKAGQFRIGPRRALPLSLLAEQDPAVIARLRAQYARPTAGDHDGRFALRLRPLDTGMDSLSSGEARIWQALGAEAVALEELLSDHHLERPLVRLLGRGLVILAAFTPSDAAHVVGLQESWSAEAAGLGAAIWARRLKQAGAPGDHDGESISRQVIDRVIVESGKALVAATLAEERGDLPSDGADSLVERALGGQSVDDGALLDFSVTLRRPLVAIGAPVASYYPEVAKRLKTRAIIPFHAGVANAVGAVASGVVQAVKALITAPDDNRYRVHLGSGVEDFADLDSAVRYAQAETRSLAETAALEAGAGDVRIKTWRDDRIIPMPGGAELFVDCEITATAVGRPRLAGS